MINIVCGNCSHPYPEEGVPYCCEKCGGVYRFTGEFNFNNSLIDLSKPGMWRYQHTFQLPKNAPITHLGEGDTPLVWSKFFNQKVALKLEFLNPTGSFKDRGTALLMSFLKSRGITSAVEDSSGNAGASFAAYSANSGIKAKLFIPSYTSGPKRNQIESYGATIISVDGPRSKATQMVLKDAERGEVYASHAYLPFGIPGFASIAYELLEQMDESPGTIISPVGQGMLLLGLIKGFETLYKAERIRRIPTLVGVQSLACAPLWAIDQYGSAGLNLVTERETLAEGVRIKHPLRGDEILRKMKQLNGFFVVVEEEAIIQGYKELSRNGFYIEPTSAIVWNALEQVLKEVPTPIVVILTGIGLKSEKILPLQ